MDIPIKNIHFEQFYSGEDRKFINFDYEDNHYYATLNRNGSNGKWEVVAVMHEFLVAKQNKCPLCNCEVVSRCDWFDEKRMITLFHFLHNHPSIKLKVLFELVGEDNAI